MNDEQWIKDHWWMKNERWTMKKDSWSTNNGVLNNE